MNWQITKSSACSFLILNLFLAINFISGCEYERSQPEPTDAIEEHVEWLSDTKLNGRLAGSADEAAAANYIADQFAISGLEPAGDEGTYFQQFVLEGPIPQAMDIENHVSRNILARAEGTGNTGEVIVIGAHYDSQGQGGMISMDSGDEPLIHPGADDNASGVAGLIWLADYFSDNRQEKDLLFIAFSGEELGLLGSRYFTQNMEISPDSVLAMVNLDMIGRMEDQKLTIFGSGTSSQWEQLLDGVEVDSLEITRTPSGTGASDHTSFYETGIPVLHYFTGTHQDYHRPTDTADQINYQGIYKVAQHAARVVQELDQLNAGEMDFTESTDPRGSTFDFDGPTLGVLPDYSYSGTGFRIDGVRDGDSADRAGMQAGDIIIQMDTVPISDIYDYMESLGDFRRGQEISVTILRDGEEMELNVTL